MDECHRGYLLDRELSDTELGFRSYDDYISKYRRVLDYFDAVKIGLTATPALHTTQIFGPPIYLYSYREAVVDGYLGGPRATGPDHDAALEGRRKWRVGEQVPVYDHALKPRSSCSRRLTRSTSTSTASIAKSSPSRSTA